MCKGSSVTGRKWQGQRSQSIKRWQSLVDAPEELSSSENCLSGCQQGMKRITPPLIISTELIKMNNDRDFVGFTSNWV